MIACMTHTAYGPRNQQGSRVGSLINIDTFVLSAFRYTSAAVRVYMGRPTLQAGSRSSYDRLLLAARSSVRSLMFAANTIAPPWTDPLGNTTPPAGWPSGRSEGRTGPSWTGWTGPQSWERPAGAAPQWPLGAAAVRP